jgi:outer membrane protein assembly factor BamB
MLNRLPRLSLSLLCLLGGLIALLWVFRSRVERFLAPPESDYTAGSTVASAYPRPSADLTPLWSARLEPGFGGAALDGREVFVLDREAGVRDTLRVFDLASGVQRWSFGYPAPGRLEFAGSRTTPVVVGEFVYTCGSFGQVHCFDRRTREPAWSLDLEADCGGRQPDFGWAASPLVHGGLVILPALGPGVGLVALDRFTGEEVWRTAELGPSHSTPVLFELLGVEQVLFLSSTIQGRGMEEGVPATISAFDPARGGELWRVTTMLTSVAIPPPVRVDAERFFVTGGYGGGSTLMHIRREAGAYVLDEVFHIEKGSQIHPPVVREGHIYLLANENSTDPRRRRALGGLVCLDLAGKELWSTGADPYFGRGQMVLLGGGHVLIQDGLSGMLRLGHVNPRGYTPLATSNVFASQPKERKKMWAPMARDGAMLVVRGQTELCCVRLGDSAVGP